MFVLCEHEISGPEIRTFQDTVLVDVWGNKGVRFGSLEDPQDIEADDEGNLLVVDTGNNRIQKFTPQGMFLTAWGQIGSAAGEFRAPIAIAVDGSEIYVVDRDNERIQLFRVPPGAPPS
jgi:tripartite motif-containing protein 71